MSRAIWKSLWGAVCYARGTPGQRALQLYQQLCLSPGSFAVCPEALLKIVLLARERCTPSVFATRAVCLQGYLAHKKAPPPQDHHRALEIKLLYVARVGRFFMSKVPL